MSEEPSQVDRFKQVARDRKCDDDEARWQERLQKVAEAEPEPKQFS